MRPGPLRSLVAINSQVIEHCYPSLYNQWHLISIKVIKNHSTGRIILSFTIYEIVIPPSLTRVQECLSIASPQWSLFHVLITVAVPSQSGREDSLETACKAPLPYLRWEIVPTNRVQRSVLSSYQSHPGAHAKVWLSSQSPRVLIGGAVGKGRCLGRFPR
jgi:hypothetical protein